MSGIEPMQIEPLEISDFSGGLTDNWFDSGPTRYAAADNFLITVDRKLQMRPGTVPFDPLNYTLPGQPRRVDALFTYINETKITVNQGRDVFVFPDSYLGWGSGIYGWERVVGPSGNEAIGAGQAYAQTVMNEFQHQLYFTNDFQPIPSRVYRDENNIYQVRTAGLPRVQIKAPYTTASLLQKCILNANTLRTAIINHINDEGDTAPEDTWTPISPATQHCWLDKWSLGYLQPVVFNGADPEDPGPIPAFVPAPNATDLPSLLTLVGALCGAYTHHATTDSGIDFYHFSLPRFQLGDPSSVETLLVGGPRALLSQNVTPLTLNQAAAILDDLFVKVYWHMFGVFLHGTPSNDVSQMSRYDYTIDGNNGGLSAITQIGDTGFDVATGLFPLSAPTVTPMVQDFLDYVDGIQAIFNTHLGSGYNNQLYPTNPIPGTSPWSWNLGGDSFAHVAADNENICTLPSSTTDYQAYLKVFWLRTLYNNYHAADAGSMATFGVKFDSTNGSPNLTNVIDSVTTLPITLPLNVYLFVFQGTAYYSGSAGYQNVGAVTASAAGTATLDRNVITGTTAQQSYYSLGAFPLNRGRRYHLNFLNGSPNIIPNYNPPTGEFLTSLANATGSDLLTWNSYAQELMYCLFTHMQDSHTHAVADGFSLQNLDFSPTVTPGISNWYIPTVSSISYGFTYFDKWTVEKDGVDYSNESNPSFTSSIQTIEPLYVGYQVQVPITAQTFIKNFPLISVQNPITVTGIPVLVNDNSTNYNTAGIVVRIYRTTNGGTTFYLDETVPNGTTSFQDTQNSLVPPPNQVLLNDNEDLYTSGGVVGNDQPPQAKVLHILNGTAYYGNILSFGQYLPNTLVQGLPGNPDSAPQTFTDTLEDAIVGISSTRSNVIVFCSNSIYRLSGAFNSLGQGAITHERISDTVGCLGVHSIVRTEIGIFFSGNDGFYYTDGFQLIKVSIDLNKSYSNATQTIAQKTRIFGAYDKTTRRIWWSMQSQPTADDCDMNYIFYLDYGIKPSGVFTTASNGGQLVPAASDVSNSPSIGNPLNYNYWAPSAIVFYQGELIRGDSRGLLFKTDDNSTSDPKIDLTIPAFTFAGSIPTQNWNTVAIPFNYASSSMDFGTHWKRKYATRMNFTGKNVGNSQIQAVAISDNGRVIGNMAPINYTQNPLWGDADFTWGTSDLPWYYAGSSDFWRRFPVGTLRANLRQIQLKNAFMGVYRSEDFPAGTSASASNITKVVTLNAPTFPAGFYGTIDWPLDVVDYYIAFADDGYVNTWQISQVATNTLTVLDPGATLTVKTNLPWVIRGYKKNQSVEISALVVRFSLFGDKTQAWKSKADSGENT